MYETFSLQAYFKGEILPPTHASFLLCTPHPRLMVLQLPPPGPPLLQFRTRLQTVVQRQSGLSSQSQGCMCAIQLSMPALARSYSQRQQWDDSFPTPMSLGNHSQSTTSSKGLLRRNISWSTYTFPGPTISFHFLFLDIFTLFLIPGLSFLFFTFNT